MDAVTVLPSELWLGIAHELRFKDLLNLTLACTRLKDVCSEMLRVQQQQLKAEYRKFDGERVRDRAEIIFRHINPTGTKNFKEFIFHKLLLDILKGCVPATFILGFETGLECLGFDNYPIRRVNPALPLHANGYFKEEDDELISRAVETSPWILRSEVEDFIQHIRLGSEDAVLCILIPLLSTLRFFGTPAEQPRLEKAIGIIACASSPSATMKLCPLSMLTLIQSPLISELEYGLSFDSIAPYAALTSVRRVLMFNARSHREGSYTGWPQDLPFSKASEVFFQRSSVIPADVRRFAAGFEGPCVIRQDWTTASRAMPPTSKEPEWDYYEVTGELDYTGKIKTGTRCERIEMRDNGGPRLPEYMIGGFCADYWVGHR